MYKPVVAVVGRPNVGKSTFFNKICGKRISIVDDAPGVTRDRIYADAEWSGHAFTLVDTGGIDERSEDAFQKDIRAQAEIAIREADVIVFLVDGRVGVTTNDEEVASILQRSKTPVVLVVNKLDNFEVEKTYEFYSLGLGEPHPLSLMQSKGIGDILDAIVACFKERPSDNLDENVTKVAVVGRPNVGKSSLVNRLLGENRVVVSDIEGTTRDAVLVPFKYNKKDYALVDTAGLRRQRSVEKVSVEGYSVLRTMSAIEEADVVLIVLDGSQEITEQDVRIAGLVDEADKPSVIVVNKWDIKSRSKEDYLKMLSESLAFMSYFQVIFVSALTGSSVGQIMENAEKSYQNASKRITTGLLNDLLHEAILNYSPPAHNGARVKIKYITQASTNPPTFVLFVNDPKYINFSYRRYLENRFRERIDLKGTPIKFILKGREEE